MTGPDHNFNTYFNMIDPDQNYDIFANMEDPDKISEIGHDQKHNICLLLYSGCQSFCSAHAL